jgi:thioredoxin 1
MAERYAGRLQVAKLQTDASPLALARFRVRAIPNLVLLRSGQIVEQIVGTVSTARLVQAIDQLLAA